jgi:Right handed beta helix region
MHGQRALTIGLLGVAIAFAAFAILPSTPAQSSKGSTGSGARGSAYGESSDRSATGAPVQGPASRPHARLGYDYPRPAGSIEPPASISANCSANVSTKLQDWLRSLPRSAIVYSPPSSCYLVNNGIKLSFPKRLTIDGGTFRSRTLGSMGRRVFDVIGGSGITFENMRILGPDVRHLWVPKRAFQSGIELQGTRHAQILHVSIADVFGDGITLAPLRGGAGHNSGVIVRPVEDLLIDNVSIDGAGRQGISPVSVDGATMRDVTIRDVNMNAFDFEADQGNEGAKHVLIDGCSISHANSLANIAEDAGFTGPITIENCSMATLDSGVAIYVTSASNDRDAGRIAFVHDLLRCRTKAPGACIQLQDANNFAVDQSRIVFGPGTGATESVFSVTDKTHATFADDLVTGYGSEGSTGFHSSVAISGGLWQG